MFPPSALGEAPFLLAPMAGVTDAAYRIMCRRHGAVLAYSEMVSVAGLAFASARTIELAEPHAEEPQLSVQLFGSKPAQFAAAVEMIQQRVGERLSLVDINMACPVRKVVSKGEGAALMDKPDLAARIVRACVSVARVPVTAKIRIGTRSGTRTAPELARRLEQEGLAAVAVHGRTAAQLYRGRADWSIIDEVACGVTIPVIGSGDVLTAEAAVAMLRDTAASAVMIARGSYGEPWIFEDAASIARGNAPRPRSRLSRLAALREHLALARDHAPHMSRARTFSAWYLKGMPNAAAWRARLVRCGDYDAFCALIDEIENDVVSEAREEPR
ncbi:tRNA-U20-dihydrouridine synthase [Coriobacterium glomerans PW2]|uniref:tRNA-dihydrouridine synthase n=1 Tax=Coriobacterium glomerans (strain ATCC 49209 / DSM 20642 / JCM 10262 / PW2) TaxID=700015 RepID=F2N7P8_CORGP|nr:tRNA-U20-dihydrouridine synthase [Coriobacterium glomerans PW2]